MNKKMFMPLLVGIGIIVFTLIIVFLIFKPYFVDTSNSNNGDKTQILIKKENDHVTKTIIDNDGDNKPDETITHDSKSGKQTSTTPSPSDREDFHK